MSRIHKRWHPLLLGVAGILPLLIAPWLVAVHLGVREVILPAPSAVVRTAAELLSTDVLIPALLVSLARVNAGFVLAIVSAVPLGILLGRRPVLLTAAEPIIESFRFIVPFAWIPLAILWFGTSEAGKIFIIWYAGFFVMLLPAIFAVQSVNPDLVKAARALGASELAVFRKVIFPAILPELMVAMRVAFSLCWISILAAELVASRSGLGYIMADARELLRTDIVLVGMTAIGLVGAFYNWLFTQLARWVAH